MDTIIKIIYIYEDNALLYFIKPIVNRILTENTIDKKFLFEEFINARGSKVNDIFFKYLKNFRTMNLEMDYDLLIVCRDANKDGYKKVKKELTSKQNKFEYPFSIVFALPDPHVQRWYLLDVRAFCDAVGGDSPPELPPFRKKKDFYKAKLGEALKNYGIRSAIGGAEYGEDIASLINIGFACSIDESFKGFIDDLEFAVKKLKRN